MNIKASVKEILETRLNDLKNPKSLVSMYGIEKQTNQGYNGRQLLELFQNCEDEGATDVRIFLDTENCVLKISNNGNRPFSIKGYNSIFYPGLSAKVSSGYIGNKGLGFRSIINWADEISIISNDFKVVFSEAFKKDILINELEYTDESLQRIREERKFNKNVLPLPFLNSCEIKDLDFPHQYTTTIAIKYKKAFEEDVIKQLRSISEKTLLFLRNINTIRIEGNVIQNTISIGRKAIDDHHTEINYNGHKYFVLSNDGEIDKNLLEDIESTEPKRYSVKIAYNNDLSFRDEVMYNYFKTQIPFELPFVVHASLELDQNRNHSTESKVNSFVLEKLFELHLRFIEVLKTKLSMSWLPFQAINNKDFDVYKPYSEMIDEFWDEYKVYPTLSGKYGASGQVVNLGNKISKFLKKNSLEEYCKSQIMSSENIIRPLQYVSKPENYTEIIEFIAKGLNIQQRATFIKLLLDSYPNNRFCVLIDEYENLIKAEDYVYTDKTGENKDLKVPSFSNIRFIHSSLYRALIEELDLSSEPNKSRTLKDKLESISDVHSFEPQTVIKKIISETDNYLKKNNPKATEVIIEFFQKLYYNYKLRPDIPKLDYDSKIPCLNRSGQVRDIRELVLSEEFEIGKANRTIFNFTYPDEFVISRIEDIGLKDQDLDEIEVFLKWLGVNSFFSLKLESSNIPNEYLSYIRNRYGRSIDVYQLFYLESFEEIINDKGIDINSIIAWLSIDEQIKGIFSNYSIIFSDKEKLIYHHYGQKKLSPFKNFIYFLISTRFQIENYLITSKRNEWFNPFKVDYEYLNNINPDLEKMEVDRILSFFGAKKDFNELDIEYLKQKTQELANKRKPKGAQVFYKNLVGHYKQNQKKLLNVDLYAREGNNIVVKDSTEIYYSDRIQLPDSLTNDFPILYYPSRSGGTTAIEMFGLKNLNDLDLDVKSLKINESLSEGFQQFIQEIKPFILAFRLDKITKEEEKKRQVQRLNKLKIICCEELICELEIKPFKIEPFDYVFSNSQYYINIPSGIDIFQLRQIKKFRDNLSDVFLKVFDTLDEKKTFESLILQSTQDNIYDINNELAEGILEESKILLGEISVRLSIWKSIFALKKIEVQEHLDENNLEEIIYRFFPDLDKELLFVSDDNMDHLQRIKKVFDVLGLDLIDYNNSSEYKISFDKIYNKEFKEYYNSIKKNLKDQIWYYLSSKEIAIQKQFLKELYKIEHLFDTHLFVENASRYNFDKIIISELKKEYPLINFDLNSDQYPNYDLTHKKNILPLSEDEELELRKNEVLNSLSYFHGQMEFIKSELGKLTVNNEQTKTDDYNWDITGTGDLVHDFEIELGVQAEGIKNKNGPWLGDKKELSPNQKKKLGNKVEKIVEEYLLSRPDLYTQVEHIAKTNEGEHYDLSYYDSAEEKTKYVECKFYNGSSFLISREEKRFADDNEDQFELWLVNKDSKIFCVKNIILLGELQPVNYRVNIKLNEYAISN
ncbi:hypothetical protein APR41_05215 [Salegentibacter salinarum]|uniref:Protein NO VEIN C-terminal domain-containing protein n=1 Tax=Salegentibacter salinarum TaxID=447422 RepID=A0A2N0TS94_9FLAO|nr:DUF3883 domain-containing protein [Salegentibacter salinarum]PKD17611.1 hypothetical protein APR41_05215 [Salegentibacter salinarum]SKB49639.1 protein of unknown function [Salegentibacter salinarum]